MSRITLIPLFSMAILLSGCITTAMQGYADRDPPAQPIKHVVAYVVAPTALASSFQSSIVEQASKQGILAEDALILLPPTRTYNDVEIRKVFAETSVDAILIINVGDSGVVKEYAGTFFEGQYSGSTETTGTFSRAGNFGNVSLASNTSGTMTGTSTPIHRYSRQTVFKARLVDPTSGRNFWVGSGEVNAGGKLFVGTGTSASSAVSAIFDELRAKKIITGTS